MISDTQIDLSWNKPSDGGSSISGYKIEFKEETWGSVLFLEYEKNGKKENFQYSVAQDWVKYPLKEPTKFLKVDWEPFVQYVKERQ